MIYSQKPILFESINQYFQSKISLEENREIIIHEHINSEIEKFRKRILNLAISNDYPYIKTFLEIAANNFEEEMKKGVKHRFGKIEMRL